MQTGGHSVRSEISTSHIINTFTLVPAYCKRNYGELPPSNSLCQYSSNANLTLTFDIRIDAVSKETSPGLIWVRPPTSLGYLRLPHPDMKNKLRLSM